MANEHYSEFVREAFIKPIRSVLIVDDDYPTFDEMIDLELVAQEKKEKQDKKKLWYQNPERIRTVIRSFREPLRPLLVDIHDGTNVGTATEAEVADHLHQSDFLVLDYQLDRDRENDGSRAIEIIKRLAANRHFNLVLVHTNTDLDTVFNEVRMALFPRPRAERKGYRSEAAIDALEKAEGKREGFTKAILAAVDSPQYIHSRLESEYLRDAFEGRVPFLSFKSLSDEAGLDKREIKFVLEHALAAVERRRISEMAAPEAPLPESSGGGVRWLRTDTVFVAFCSKEHSGNLLEEMAKALDDWRPPPSRLYLAKIRAEMDEHGVAVQDLALGHTHALAHWYDRLLKADVRARRSLVAESVGRHSEQLMSGILDKVVVYAERLVQAELAQGGGENLALRHFKVDLTDDAARAKANCEHNAFVCSKPPDGWHLTTGHVFTLDGDHWVCLSPACDTVPQQLSASKRKSFGARLPFMAVKLLKRDPDEVAGEITSNRYLYLRLDGKIVCFAFNEKETSAPYWRVMYAEKEGELQGMDFKVVVTKLKDDDLAYISSPARVVSQLRYEYALNLIQKLGVSMTRIGLDFSA